jgi:hypothetical protein
VDVLEYSRQSAANLRPMRSTLDKVLFLALVLPAGRYILTEEAVAVIDTRVLRTMSRWSSTPYLLWCGVFRNDDQKDMFAPKIWSIRTEACPIKCAYHAIISVPRYTT